MIHGIQKFAEVLTVDSGLALLPPLLGDSTLAVTEVVTVVIVPVIVPVVTVAAIVPVIVPVTVAAIVVVNVATVLLLVAAIARNRLVDGNSLLARMIAAATATVVIGIVIGTTTTVADLAALPIVSATERTVTAATKTARPPPMATSAKVTLTLSRRLLSSTPTMSSWPGTNADSRLSPRIATACSR